jgi:integrase
MATKTEQRQHINAWVDPELARRLDEKAREADRSRSAEIRIALRQHVEPEQGRCSSDPAVVTLRERPERRTTSPPRRRAPCAEEAGLDATEDRLSWHSLRHSFASMLATDLELPATTLARLTGHADAAFTLKVTPATGGTRRR